MQKKPLSSIQKTGNTFFIQGKGKAILVTGCEGP
jgi:hypothetical protein